MTRDEARMHAKRAAAAVWRSAGGTQAFDWSECLGAADCGTAAFARWIDDNPGAPAAALYAFAVKAEPKAKPWPRAAPQLRVALETFRATYLALLRLAEEDCHGEV